MAYASLHIHATTATYRLPIKVEEKILRRQQVVETLHLRLARVPIALNLRLARVQIVLNLLRREEVAPQQALVLAQGAAQLHRKVTGVPKALVLAQAQVQATRIQVLLRVLAQVPAVALPLQPVMVLLRVVALDQELEPAAQVPDP
jgi:hypothetical protein